MKLNQTNRSIIVGAIVPQKTYQTPALKRLGTVQSLTLKLGSLTDSGQAGQFT